MTEIALKDIMKEIEEEHNNNSNKFGNILDDIDERRKKSKYDTDIKDDSSMRSAEPADEEPEDQLPGARANDMNKWQI
eukprot:4212819-Heterocapsa_arctica.AAC.1